MGFQKVLLFRPDPEIDLGVTLLPTGLGILAEQLERSGTEYEICDMALGYRVAELKARIAAFAPDLLGCNLISFGYKKHFRILEEIKESFPAIPIVVGGPHVSMFEEQVLQECPAVDYAVVREGEETFMDLVHGLPPQDIKGLYYREGPQIRFAGEREPLRDLDRFGYPKYEKFERDKYTSIIPIYSSRGCPYSCIFCAIKDVIGKPFRAISNDLLLEQIQYWHRMGYRRIAFSDDNFTCRPKRVFQFCARLKEAGLTGLDLAVWDTRADSTSRELLVAMKEVGFVTLLIGVESANNRVLKIIRKGETIEQIERMVKDACELGFAVQLSFLIGVPSETIEDVERSFEFALKYPIKGVSFFNIVPTPNTELLASLEATNSLTMPPEVYLNSNVNTGSEPLFETPEISFAERQRLLKQSAVVSRQVIKNYWLHKLNLRRLGFFGRMIVAIGTSHCVNTYILKNRYLKKMLKTVLGLSKSRAASDASDNTPNGEPVSGATAPKCPA